ncbi:unnamed protein product [Merluccius merluccius]
MKLAMGIELQIQNAHDPHEGHRKSMKEMMRKSILSTLTTVNPSPALVKPNRLLHLPPDSKTAFQNPAKLTS